MFFFWGGGGGAKSPPPNFGFQIFVVKLNYQHLVFTMFLVFARRNHQFIGHHIVQNSPWHHRFWVVSFNWMTQPPTGLGHLRGCPTISRSCWISWEFGRWIFHPTWFCLCSMACRMGLCTCTVSYLSIYYVYIYIYIFDETLLHMCDVFMCYVHLKDAMCLNEHIAIHQPGSLRKSPESSDHPESSGSFFPTHRKNCISSRI